LFGGADRTWTQNDVVAGAKDDLTRGRPETAVALEDEDRLPEISDALAMNRPQEDASAIDALSSREFEMLRMLDVRPTRR
jgi:hypothetical protein